MKNRIIKIINILLIISFIFAPLISYAEPVETEETPEAEKGTLRCPSTISDPNVKCSVVDGGNAVEITYGSLKNAGDVQIIKRVAKTDEVGKYSVTFTVKGKNLVQTQVNQDATIFLIIDTSHTVKNVFGAIKTASFDFSAYFKDEKNVKFAIIQFADISKVVKSFTDQSFEIYGYNANADYANNQFGRGSHVEKALDDVEKLLIGNEKDLKYVVLLGDGQYWENGWVDIPGGKRKFQALRDKGVKFYMIQFSSSAASKNEGGNKNYIQNHIKPVEWWCNYGNYDYSKKNWCINNNKKGETLSYQNIFRSIATSIKKEIDNSVIISEGNLIDTIGTNFTLTDSYNNVKEYIVRDITESGVSLEPFYININPASETDWHKTNESFTFKYTLNDGTEKKINCDDNPEVYWIQEKEDIDSCSGEIKSPKITKTITNSYYSIHCEEGYTENGKKYENFTTAMKVNSLDDGVKEFTLPSGAGFTAEVSLKTNIRCTYKFDASRYNSEYATLEREIAQLEKEIESLKTSSNNQILEAGDIASCKYTDSSGDQLTATMTLGQVSDTSSMKPIESALYGKKVGDVFEVTIHDSVNDTDEVYTVNVISITKKVDILEKELAQKILNFNSLTSIADDYLNTSSEMALDEYKDRFFNLSPGLGVSYKNKKGEVVVNLSSNIVDKEPKGDEKFNNKDEDPVCQGTEDTIQIGNKTVKVFNQTCTGNFWRIMNIEKICLNMKTGQTEKCSDTDTTKQLDGLNKHYTPLQLDEDTKKMMKLDGDIVITLEKAGYDESINVTLKNCTVKGQISDAYYREIDVTDPFLQKATHGQRAIGSNYKGEYDFVQIISPTIWNSNNPLYTFNLSKADVAAIENDTTNLGKISYLGDDCYISNRKYVCTLPHQYKK